MKRCPITYQEIEDSERYSERGLKLLAPRLKGLKDFPFTAEQARREAATRATRMSIQGVQPKLSVVLNVQNETFEITDRSGRFILKPQNPIYEELPENEDVTMRLASTIGMEVPLHGLIYCADGSLSYFVKRFDRYGRAEKYALEDFAQLSSANRDTKYDQSMEQVVKVIDKYCTFPAVERVKFFKLTLFNYLIGNEDMHLKNFSLITTNDKVRLSPCYDLLNSTIANPRSEAELALALRGKRNKLKREDFLEYLGHERLKIPEKVTATVLEELKTASHKWPTTITSSFLSKEMKGKYTALLTMRSSVLFP